MLKKLLSIVLATMLLSSIAVVSNAETTGKTEWTENFDSYDASYFGSASATSTSPLWVLTGDCTEGHTAYKSNDGTKLEMGHYHLNDGWTMQSKKFRTSTSYDAYNAWKLASGDYGKKNSDKSLYDELVRYANITLKNDFEGTPVDLTTEKAVGFSFDWYNNSKENHSNGTDVVRHIIVTATLAKDGADDIPNVELELGKIEWATLTPAVGSTSVGTRGSWNDFAMLISKDKVMMQAASEATTRSLDITKYDPATGAWAATTNSGYYIKSVKSVEVYIDRDKRAGLCKNGMDNLKAWIEDEMPNTLPTKSMGDFMNFAPVKTVNVSGTNVFFKDNRAITVTDDIGVDSSTEVIDASLVNDNDEEGTLGQPRWLKIAAKTDAEKLDNATYKIRFSQNNIDSAAVGDTVQTSCNIKLNGSDGASSTHNLFEIDTNFVSGGKLLGIAADGSIFDADNSNVALAKLSQNTWYELDMVFELKESVTEATVYINGVPVLEKDLSTPQYIPDIQYPQPYQYLVRFTYNPERNADDTAYLANTVYLGNLCHNVFEDGVGVYNFDKFLTNASNKVVAAATADFVNNVIAPVSEDWTVADFNDLGLANATVVDSNGAVVTEGLLKDNNIKFTGDYGKDRIYSVSENGATRLGEEHLVIVKQGSDVKENGNAVAVSAISAKAYNAAGAVTVITAEYEGDVLVATKIGEDLTPTKAGNTIKVFALTNLNTLVPIAPHTEFTVE